MRSASFAAGLGWLATRLRMGLAASIVTLATVIGGYAWLVRAASRHGGSEAMVPVLALAPAVAVIVAIALLNLFPAYVRWVDERIWTPWHGRYHAFDGRQVRVVEARDVLWFSSADVHAVLGLPRRAHVLTAFRTSERRIDAGLGEVLSNAGLERLLARSTDRLVRRFVLWADGDVQRPWAKKRARDGLAVRADVETTDRPSQLR